MAAGSRRCCPCNGPNAKCSRCSCQRSGLPCISCHPLSSSTDCFNNHNGQVSPPPATSASSATAVAASASPSIPVCSRSPTYSTNSGIASVPHFLHPDGSSGNAAVLPSLFEIQTNRVSTLHHVPKAGRILWAEVLASCLSVVASRPLDLDAWSRLFILPKCILVSPASRRQCHWRRSLQLIKAKIKKWKDGYICSLWSDALSQESQRFGSSRRRNISQANARRARQATEEGQYKKALQFLTSSGLASPSPEVLEALCLQHPHHSQPSLPLSPIPPHVIIESSVVVKAVHSFPAGSAPGLSDLRASHIKEAISCPSPMQASAVLQALTKFINVLSSGNVPPVIIPYLCGASLVAIPKKNGGVRPIAIGEVLRCLASKCILRLVMSEARCYLDPRQVGVGVPVGAEAIIHSIRSIFESSSILPNNK